MRRLGLIALLSFFVSQIANALPCSDLSYDESASDVVSGLVIGTTRNIVYKGDNFADAVFTVRMRVIDIERTSDIKKGDTVMFTYWQAYMRPNGYEGDMGQMASVQAYTPIKAYLMKNPDRSYSLVSPIGFMVED
jgi:hypothetical protein